MSSAKERMKQAYNKESQKAPTTQPIQQVIKSAPATPVKEQPKPEVTVPADTPTPVKQIARPDVDISTYGLKPVATNFNCYNRELWKWLTSFSSDNRFNGGSSITKSQLMEISLDVIMYDLGINPIGYESQQELREAIQNRIREIN
jgi:hypothetical protein